MMSSLISEVKSEVNFFREHYMTPNILQITLLLMVIIPVFFSVFPYVDSHWRFSYESPDH